MATGGRIVIWRAPEYLTDDWLRRTHGLTVVHREIVRGRMVKTESDWMEVQKA